MIKNRLSYETLAGNLDESATYKQLIEYLRLAIEDMKELQNNAKRRGRDDVSTHWNAIAKSFTRAIDIISHLDNTRTQTSTGFHAPKPH